MIPSAETLRHEAPFAFQQLSLEVDPVLLCRLEEQCLVGVSGRVVVVVYANHGLVEQFSRGEYSTGIFSSAAVDPVAVKAGSRSTETRSNAQT